MLVTQAAQVACSEMQPQAPVSNTVNLDQNAQQASLTLHPDEVIQNNTTAGVHTSHITPVKLLFLCLLPPLKHPVKTQHVQATFIA
jgi:hypothetical protein